MKWKNPDALPALNPSIPATQWPTFGLENLLETGNTENKNYYVYYTTNLVQLGNILL